MSVRSVHLFFACLYAAMCSGQGILNNIVTLDHKDDKANVIFNDIHLQTGAVFSYSNFNENNRFTIVVKNMTLKNLIPVLETELHVSITVKEKYLIVKNEKNENILETQLTGAIRDYPSDEPIEDASIYVLKPKLLTKSDSDGRFAITIPSKVNQIRLYIAKANYVDTSLVVIVNKAQNLHIRLKSYPRQTIQTFDSLSKKELPSVKSISIDTSFQQPDHLTFNARFWEKQKEKNVNLININDTLLNRLSISLFPPISTNKLLAYHTKNNVSINIIGGNSKGTEGIEMGGVYNFNAGDVSGIQIAGVVNRVSDDVIGTQVSGVLNAVSGKFDGVQIAGVVNYNDSTTVGVQIAGVWQKTVLLYGLQVSGICNEAINSYGLQIGGIANYSKQLGYTQIAGLYNKAGVIKGTQVSGIVNVCDTLNGLQIGLINFSKHINKGFSIGLVNYSKDGYHKLELASNDQSTFILGYRSGWAPLYFHYFGGINLTTKENRFLQSGFGFCSSSKLTTVISLESDLNVRFSRKIDDITSTSFNMHSQAFLGLSWQPFKKIGLRTGLSLNHFYYDNSSEFNSYLASTTSNLIYQREGPKRNERMWIGWQLGILLF